MVISEDFGDFEKIWRALFFRKLSGKYGCGYTNYRLRAQKTDFHHLKLHFSDSFFRLRRKLNNNYFDLKILEILGYTSFLKNLLKSMRGLISGRLFTTPR